MGWWIHDFLLYATTRRNDMYRDLRGSTVYLWHMFTENVPQGPPFFVAQAGWLNATVLVEGREIRDCGPTVAGCNASFIWIKIPFIWEPLLIFLRTWTEILHNFIIDKGGVKTWNLSAKTCLFMGDQRHQFLIPGRRPEWVRCSRSKSRQCSLYSLHCRYWTFSR